jgi:hypothetical protein
MNDKNLGVTPNAERTMSWRSFLKGSAVTGLAISLRHSWLGTDIHLMSGPEWVAVYRDNRQVFRLTSNAFYGNPNVWTERNVDAIAFGLEKARFPGTDTCADFVCELWKGVLGVQANLNYEVLGLSFRGFAHQWLDEEGLWARLRKPINLVDSSEFGMAVGVGDAKLSKDGILQFYGQSLATLNSGASQLGSNRVDLCAIAGRN